ncbi:MAG: lipopolysaccharide biosynthesis protein [Ruminococcaceae bacterium]|nr:lipopolysaccharide biosynthesis protein [Oscillospiraceae bacterium]
MSEQNIKKKTVSGLFWRFMEMCGSQGVTFVVSVVLARLLDPAVYGTIALVTVFTAILQVFVDSGLGNALIQKKESDQLDFSTVFYFNIVACLAVYALLFFTAPLIAHFYEDDGLVPLIRVMSLTVVISALKNVQQAYVFKNMMYRKFFFSTIGGTIGAAVVGITAAYCGLGVWALVLQQLFNLIVGTIVLWITVKWRPSLVFSFERLKSLFSYGWKLLVSSLLHTIYTKLRTLIIGKMYSEEDLSFYDKGQHLPTLVVTNINNSVDSVLFPAMSSEQDDRENVKRMTRRAITISSYIMWPLMIGLAVVAKPLVEILLTEKWLPAVPYLQIACITLAFEPIHTANLNAIKALGRSDIYFKLEIIKKTVSLIILLAAMYFGVIWIALSAFFYALVATVINSYPNSKILNYKYLDQMKDLLPSVVLACIMGAVVYPIAFLKIPLIAVLFIQVVVGVVVYVLMSHIFKVKSYLYLKDTVKNFFKRR